MAEDMAEAAVQNGLTEAQLEKIEALAQAENRPVSAVVADMVELYIKGKSLQTELHDLTADGKTHAEKLGYKPRNDTEAMGIVNKKRQELRNEDKRGK